MAYNIVGTTLEVTGTDNTLATLHTFVSGHSLGSTLGYSNDPNSVIVNYRIELKIGSELDISLGTLFIKEQMRAEGTSTTRNGKLINNGGTLIVTGTGNYQSEAWCLFETNNGHFIYNKASGATSFYLSSASAANSSIKNSTFIVNGTAYIDTHFRVTGGTGTFENNTFINKSTSPTKLGLFHAGDRFDGLKVDNINIGTLLNQNGETFVINSSFNQSTEADYTKLVLNHRRELNLLFYNVRNPSNNNARYTEINYRTPASGSVQDAQSAICGKFHPVVKNTSGQLISGAKVNIYKGNNTLVRSGETNVSGEIDTSSSGSITFHGTTYNDGPFWYIIQSQVPATTGGAINSVDVGNHLYVIKEPHYLEFRETRKFFEDLEGDVFLVRDNSYTASISASEFPTIRNLNTNQLVYDYNKLFDQDQHPDMTNFTLVDGELREVKNIVVVGSTAYDPTAGTYAVGDYTIHNDDIYINTTAITTPEAFDSSKWTLITTTTHKAMAATSTHIYVRTTSQYSGDIRVMGDDSTVSFVNGATTSGNIFDSNGDSLLNINLRSQYTSNLRMYSTAANAISNTNPTNITGTSLRYLNTALGGQTRYFRAEDASNGNIPIIQAYTFPNTAGTHTFDFLVSTLDIVGNEIKGLVNDVDTKVTANKTVVDSIKTRQDTINDNVKDSSLFIPANRDLT